MGSLQQQGRAFFPIALAAAFGLVLLSCSSIGSITDVESGDGSEEVTITKGRTAGRRLLMVPEAKKEALNGLEDVLLEPPQEFSPKQTRTYLRRTKYLPDLMGDALDGYPRRVFVDVGPPINGDDVGGWFKMHYPTRNRMFEIIRVETKEASEAEEDEMSGWLERNVGEEDYVVMKAEADVVEGLVRSRAIGLVDELFLECRHRWEKGDGKVQRRSKRAYWECLALYGKLRDEGVAVHQWWG